MLCTFHNYQKYSKNWIIENPYCALLLDMGMGKTLSTLSALNELLYDYFDIPKVLIIAPKLVAEKTWPDEIKKWDHLKDLSYSIVLGTEKQRIEALKAKVDVYLINRENIVWLTEYYKKDWPFEAVVIDELSSFKSPKSKRFRALKKVRPMIKRMVGLTGTPAPNSLIDLWSQIYLLDQGERLGKTLGEYKSRYFTAGAQNGHIVYEWKLRPGAEDEIFEKISDICVSMKAKDYLDLPERVNNYVELELSPKQKKQYDQLERDLVLPLLDAEIVAANAAVLSNKLLQLAQGCIYDANREPQYIHDVKLDALEAIIEEAQGQPVLVFYQYKHDLERIQKRFKTAIKLEASDIPKWNKGEISLLCAQPQSTGHGLNLQKGGHLIVWFGLNWSLEYYQQANGRLDRQGQTETVIVHHLVTKGTEDEKVIQRLKNKEIGQDAMMEAVKAKIEEVRRKWKK